jgi:hypothetical protein
MVVGHPHSPPSLGDWPCDRQVAAQRNEHARVRALVGGLGGAVSSERLGRRAEVELDSPRDANRALPLVHDHDLPAGDGRDPDRCGDGHAGSDLTEVAVIAESDQRLADGWVDVAIGQPSGAQSRRHGVEQQLAHTNRGAIAEHVHLRVRTEARACSVERVDHVLDRAARAL